MRRRGRRDRGGRRRGTAMRWGRWWASRSERADFELVVAELDDGAVLDDLPARVVVVRLRRDDDGAGELATVENEERVAAGGGGDALPVGEQEVQPRRRELVDEADDRDQRVGGRRGGVEPVEHECEQELRVRRARDAERARLAHLAPQLAADAGTEAGHETVVREEPRAFRERRRARLLDWHAR